MTHNKLPGPTRAKTNVPSMWINDCPEAVAYYRRTSVWARLRARLPVWLGGQPLYTLTPGDSKQGLTALRSTALSLISQRALARNIGRTGEVDRLTRRIAETQRAQSRIKRVV